jgi:ankyrin repeat protein
MAHASPWALQEAAADGDVAAKQLLLEGATVDAADEHGFTALHKAVDHCHASVVQLLLKAGAAVDAADAQHRTPLHKAADSGHISVVELLLFARATVDDADARGSTALHMACGNGHVAVVELLLDAQAAVNASDEDRWTPLHAAADAGHSAVAQLLLDAQGRTPLQCAACEGRTETVPLLLAAPQLATATISGAARAAAAAGQGEMAIMVLKALIARDRSAAGAVLADPAVSAEVMRRWQAAEFAVQELRGRWPALQGLLVGFAATHKQLRASEESITNGAVSAALHAAGQGVGEPAGEAAMDEDASGDSHASRAETAEEADGPADDG